MIPARSFWKFALLASYGAVFAFTNPDSVIVERNHRQFEQYIHLDPERAAAHLDTLKQFRHSSFPRAFFLYSYDAAYLQFTRNRLDEAAHLYTDAWEYSRANELRKETVYSEIWVANLLFFQKRWDSARYHYREIIQKSKDIRYIDGIANGYYGLASTTDDETAVLRAHLKIDSIYTANDTISPILSNSLGAIGKIYLKSNFVDRARWYFEKSFEVAEKVGYVPGISYKNKILGEIAKRTGDYELAESYFKQALEDSKARKDTIFEAHNYINLGRLNLVRGKFSEAEQYILQAQTIYGDKKDSVGLTNTYLSLAALYSKVRDLNKAALNLQLAKDHPYTLSDDEFTLELLKTSVLFFEASGDFQKAYENQRKHDSLMNVQMASRNNVAFIELERRETEAKKEREIAMLNAENELSEQKRINQRNIFLGGLALSTLLGVFLFVQYRNKKRHALRLLEFDQLKSRFYANISHEFRTPLTLISGPIEARLSNLDLPTEDQRDFELIQRNSKRLLSLVNQLQDLSKLECGKYTLAVARGDLGIFLSGIAASFRFWALQNNIKYKVEIDTFEKAWFDRDAIEKIVTNLLSNAFKYTEDEGRIIFSASADRHQVFLTVENTSSHLVAFEGAKLFERFYQVDPHAEGVGIGLSLVKELVTLYRGKLSVTQPEDGLVRFCIALPITKEQFREEELTVESIDENYAAPGQNNSKNPIANATVESFGESEQDIILVVEDHHEIRQLIATHLNDQYTIIEARDGQEGLKLAVEVIPDLVISDVMMPGMDGMALLQSLKNDERTSHIPIVLLTAKAGEEDQYKGLREGADAYITKPFNLKILKTRVENLIESRKQLRDRYSQEVILKPRDIAITNLDEQFLERVQQVLEAKLTESDFSIQEFSEAVGMSRMQLHRKIKALTGLSASEFVRSQRLKLAADLLRKSDANIAQIGYEVGFKDPSYFTKCFRKAYGVSPGAYSKKNSS